VEDYSDIPQNGPSLSRKGGIRLHPIRDGLIPLVANPDRIKVRDQGGNSYTEVTDTSTGWCTGVTSPLTIPDGCKVLVPSPIVPLHNPKRDLSVTPQKDSQGNWYTRKNASNHAIRTVEMGDEALPSIVRGRAPVTRKGGAVRSNGSPASASDRPTRTRRAPMPTALVDAYIRGKAQQATAKGKNKKGKLPANFVITDEMRRAARLAIKHEQNVQEYCAK
jgi:hypothetical protein